MATSYPGALDSWTNPTSSTTMDASGYEHDVVHSNELDAIEAIEGELGTDPAGGAATVAARLDNVERAGGRTSAAWPSGKYLNSNLNFGANSAAQTLVANTVYYVPWLCPLTASIDRIAVEVTTGVAGNARLGIYSPASSGYPGALLLDAGTVDTSVAAIKELTVSQALVGGTEYWLALQVDAAASWRGSPGAGLRTLPLAATSDGAYGFGRITESYAYASGLPATATTTPTTGSATAYPPTFWLRRA